jgi:hypothetical protein
LIKSRQCIKKLMQVDVNSMFVILTSAFITSVHLAI